jgi:DNA-binding IclR family transcriptional regulator
MPKAKTEQGDLRKTQTSYLERVFALLHILTERADTGARLPEIADRLKIHRVNIHRMINSLMELGYVEQAPDLSYHLGFEAWRLGQVASQLFIPPAVSAIMNRIAEASGESVFLMRRSGNEGVCIAARDGAVSFRSSLGMSIGVRRYLGIGGTSVAILAGLDPAEAAEIMKANTPFYEGIGLTYREVRDLVADTRKNGYSYSKGVMLSEVRTVAVSLPRISETRTAQLAMSIVTLASRMPEEKRKEFAAALREEILALPATNT